jgi:hypothetical protein
MPLERMIADVVDEAIGKGHRVDPVLSATGGPAGNARLTAWTGLLLLVLIAVETVTLLDVRGLISWHVVVGTLLVPVALLKTVTTSWRIGRYYTGNRPYKSAGPPPMPLRILGPFVVVSTLGVLGSGLALIALGPASSRTVLLTALGQRVDTLTLHQALFIVFAVATGLHILARVVPAVALVTGRLQLAGSLRSAVPGARARVLIVLGTLGAAAITATLVLGASTGWADDRGGHFDGRPGLSRPGHR